MAGDPVSSLFPSRPIRPLPKRRLRERLSPEVADSIQYPPLPQSTSPLFPYPYTLAGEHPDSGPSQAGEGGSRPEQHPPQTNGQAAEAHKDDAALKQGPGSRATLEHPALVTRPKPEHGRYTDSLPLLSATSSADGYDPFENTNNKKRKIPTAGDSGPSGVHATNESVAGAESTAASVQSAEGHNEAAVPTSTPYYGSGSLASGGQNIPGPGRGRYGRPRNGKNPLRPFWDSANSWAGRASKPRHGQLAAGSNESTGIISTAIANAEKLPPQHGQENISLLRQQSAAKRSPASTQFTFTCDSQVPGSLAWPGSDRGTATQPQQPAAVGQEKENWPRAPNASQTGPPSATTPQAADTVPKEVSSRGGANDPSQSTPAQKSSRKSATKQYHAAAKARRRETLLKNRRHPPKPEDIWICHFCEYETIFGRPPAALVRQYEIKERKQQQLEQQRKAQWERMKKGKHKGKKNSKLPAKSNNVAQDHYHHVDGREASVNHYGHGDQEEEFYEDEYYEDEEYDMEEEVALEHSPGAPGLHDDVPVHLGGGRPVLDGGGT